MIRILFKRRNMYLLLVGFLALLIAYNFKSIQGLVSTLLENVIGAWGLFGLFVVILLLEAIPQPVISALLGFTVASFLGFPRFQLIATTVVAGICANYLAYAVGRYYGEPLVDTFMKPHQYEKCVHWFERYGWRFFTLFGLLPLPYFPFLGGVFRMKLWGFTLSAVLPRTIHFLVFCTIISAAAYA